MTSVVIPAHDEETVLGRCLRALLADARPGEFEVLVVANGCSDRTAEVGRSFGADVTVIERASPGKVGALNEGDARASRFPRIYLDADVVLDTAGARSLVRALGDEGVHAAAPRARVVTTGCSRVVAWYYEVWSSLPVILEGYVGCGVYALDREGHERVTPFPPLLADDTYVRRSFTRAERARPPCTSVVRAPRTVRAHLHRSTRGRAGHEQLTSGASGAALVQEEAPSSARSLLPLVRRPWRWHHVAAFVALTLLVRVRSRGLDVQHVRWNRDGSSREPHPGST